MKDSEINLNNEDFNYGGSVVGMIDTSDAEILEFVDIYRGRAIDKEYHMQNDNFDTSIFLHRIWVLNFLLEKRDLKQFKITKIRKELQQEGIESAEYEHELVILRINDLFN